jgi:hypothetical protein
MKTLNNRTLYNLSPPIFFCKSWIMLFLEITEFFRPLIMVLYQNSTDNTRLRLTIAINPEGSKSVVCQNAVEIYKFLKTQSLSNPATEIKIQIDLSYILRIFFLQKEGFIYKIKVNHPEGSSSEYSRFHPRLCVVRWIKYPVKWTHE